MNYTLSSFDIVRLARELTILEGAYFNKAFMLDTGDVILRFNIKNENIDGETLRVLPGSFGKEGDGRGEENAESRSERNEKAESRSERNERTGEAAGPGRRDERGTPDISVRAGWLSGGRSETNAGRTGEGSYTKANLLIRPGNLLFLTHRRFVHPRTPPSFPMVLRKYLRNRRLKEIRQHEFDRVLILDFFTGEGTLSLVLEMFKRGNIILVADGKIVQPLFSRSFRARQLRAKKRYCFPPERFDPKDGDTDEFLRVIRGCDRDIVRCLAVELNLGGIAAEEILYRCGIEKAKKSHELSEGEIGLILKTSRGVLEDLINSKRTTVYERTDGALITSGGPLEHLNNEDNLDIVEYPSLNRALEDIGIRAVKESYREEKEADEEIERGGDENIGKLRRRISQQVRAIDKFKNDIHKNRVLGEMFYLNYKRVESILTALNRAREDLGWDEIRERIGEIPDIVSIDPSSSKAVIKLLDKADSKVNVSVDLNKDINENASAYFDKTKKARVKLKGAKSALANSLTELDAQEKRAKSGKEGKRKTKTPVKEKGRKFWFENYRWFITSDNDLVVAGRDAKSNDKLVKKYLDGRALYVHSDIQGAPSVVVLPGDEGSVIGERSLKESGVFSGALSKAWKKRYATQTAYWVRPSQVSKTPASGEYLAKGSFIIRGERNWMPKLELRMAVGKVRVEGVEKMMLGPVSALKEHSDGYVVIVPGEVEKNELAKQLARIFDVSLDILLSLLPAGSGRIVDSYGIDESLLPNGK